MTRSATKKAPAKKAAAPARRRPTKAERDAAATAAAAAAAESARLVRLLRARDVLELKRGGIGFDKIAVHPEITGDPEGKAQLDREEVYALYELALDETIPQPADRIRRAELDRLEQLIPRLYTKAQAGDLAAAREVARIAKLRVEIAEKRGVLVDGRVLGPVEEATAREVEDLKVRDQALSASALILARCVDDAGTEASAANAARELRMTMATLRALHGGAGDGGQGKPLVDPDAPAEVVPASRLAELRKRGATRGRSGG